MRELAIITLIYFSCLKIEKVTIKASQTKPKLNLVVLQFYYVSSSKFSWLNGSLTKQKTYLTQPTELRKPLLTSQTKPKAKPAIRQFN